ncbi:T6SS immunity protein Tli4 family protein [Orbus wheelerorum]|uniref:T6SS immunity protein Tli4 family protein n=1 Tax=Orbus wheelerorum TaxID=3074111 RepID=UPI00370D6E8A
MMIKRILVFVGLLVVASSQATALNYQTECIGSYTLQLPDNIEVALYPTSTYLQPKSKNPIYFDDGKRTYSSIFNYNKNRLIITHFFNDKNVLNKIVNDTLADNNKIKIEYIDDSVNLFNDHDLLSFYSNKASEVIYIKNNRIYNFYTEKRYQGIERDFAFYKQNAESIINGFSTRTLFEVPQIAGKCIPYGFVAGNNPSTPLNLGVSFRLNDHPDVVVTFTENTRSFSDALKSDAKAEMQGFWDTRYDASNDNIAAIKLLGFPKNRSITMDGRDGVAGFVEVIYKDKSPSDYGYYAVVDYYSRNAKSQKDHPWLQLSVIGKASEAKGKTPLTKDEIYALAKTIEASIMRRDTEQ